MRNSRKKRRGWPFVEGTWPFVVEVQHAVGTPSVAGGLKSPGGDHRRPTSLGSDFLAIESRRPQVVQDLGKFSASSRHTWPRTCENLEKIELQTFQNRVQRPPRTQDSLKTLNRSFKSLYSGSTPQAPRQRPAPRWTTIPDILKRITMERYVTIRYTYSVHTGIPTGTLTTDDRSIYRTWERLSLPRYTHTHIHTHKCSTRV